MASYHLLFGLCDYLTYHSQGGDVVGVFVDMRARCMAFYRNRRHIATVQGLPEAVFPALSLSGTDLSATLDFCTEGYAFPPLIPVELDPDAGLFHLECDAGTDFGL